jgi:DNA-binding HxlR family transcriptional regulator
MSEPQHKGAPPMTTATAARDSAHHLPPSCPLRDPGAMAAYRSALRSGSDLSLRTQAFLAPAGPDGAGAWIRTLLDRSQALFQPWNLEILFLVGALGEARFSTLEKALRLSSRTLSTKLALLTREGLLERTVNAGPPLRTSYHLTRHGLGTVAAGSPLLAHLNLAAVGALGAGEASAPRRRGRAPASTNDRAA